MIHLKLGDWREVEDDPMGRTHVGWKPDLTPEQIYEVNRGIWYFGERAGRERYTVFSYNGWNVAVIENSEIETIDDKKAVVGTVLGAGHPVYDELINQPAPDKHRNPVTYPTDPGGPRTCACGCGAEVSGKRIFVPGHDQRAIHDRITRQWGDLKRFIDWFDATYP